MPHTHTHTDTPAGNWIQELSCSLIQAVNLSPSWLVDKEAFQEFPFHIQSWYKLLSKFSCFWFFVKSDSILFNSCFTQWPKPPIESLNKCNMHEFLSKQSCDLRGPRHSQAWFDSESGWDWSKCRHQNDVNKQLWSNQAALHHFTMLHCRHSPSWKTHFFTLTV